MSAKEISSKANEQKGIRKKYIRPTMGAVQLFADQVLNTCDKQPAEVPCLIDPNTGATS